MGGVSMYEYHHMTIKNAVKDVELNINKDEVDENTSDLKAGINVTVTFCITTDSVAWLTVYGDGTVDTAFGGTGISDTRLENHIKHGINIYRSITGDTETGFEHTVLSEENLPK